MADFGAALNGKPKPKSGGAFEEWLTGKPKPKQSPRPTTAIPVDQIALPGANPSYVERAVSDELAKLAAATEGCRNHTLYQVGCNVFEFVKAGHVDRSAAEVELERIASAIGLGDNEIRATMRSAWDKVEPRTVPAPTSINPAHTIDPATAETDSGAPKLASLLLSRTALKELPEPEPLIDNTLDRGTVALLYGKWGTFKSFIAIDLAASVATGRAWQGRTTEKGRVLYVAAEGAFGMKGRIDAWEAGWHTTIDDGDFDILPRRVNLTNAANIRDMAALIQCNGYDFIVFDTLARCMVGADENSAKDCGVVVDNLTHLRECTPNGRGVVLAVHHTGKDGKTFRGSSVFEAGVDTVYAVDADCGIINLDREKRKDGPEADSHELRFEQIEGTGSGVIGVHRGRGQASQVDRLLSIFDQHFATTGASKADLRAVADMASSTFHRAVNTLVQSGDLVNTGTDKQPFYKRGENVKKSL